MPATGIVASAVARIGQKPRGSFISKKKKTEGERRKEEDRSSSLRAPAFRLRWYPNYWIAVPFDGDALSLPPEPIELVDCQIVPVVLVKK